ncbi:nucleotidyltransferase [Litchfieldia alkalitelluris]|uniref:nucleotidyltransferase n=1 Tax=Litchfieldia alkalitelluris TaxID=304268 RepID=UPI00099685C0|nr:nucleotidyltransferase [Litchfieldia alkalitelluris]
MKAVGVVVEYNPFHNGHKYHLEQAKSQTKADVVVAVMSGNFLQRGEPALVSKWSRTKMALENGVDIVVELPYVFATQKAETFANGAVAILSHLFCNYLCFGSEHGSITEFKDTLSFLERNQEVFNELVKKAIQQGVSYPRALSLSYDSLVADSSLIDLTQPNNILGYHYVKAIYDQKQNIVPFTIQRTNANYHDENFSSETIASATSIRKSLFKNNGTLEQVRNYIPLETNNILNQYKQEFGQFHEWDDYFHLLKYKIVTNTEHELQEFYEIEEGLEHRIKRVILKSTNFNEFMQQLKTKRYTWTRLQRACLHILTNSKKSSFTKTFEHQDPSYIRLLGMSQKGQHYLSSIKKDISVPVISKLSSFTNEMIQLDINAAYAYSMTLPEPIRSNFLLQEYSTPPLRYNETSCQYI